LGTRTDQMLPYVRGTEVPASGHRKRKWQHKLHLVNFQYKRIILIYIWNSILRYFLWLWSLTILQLLSWASCRYKKTINFRTPRQCCEPSLWYISGSDTTIMQVDFFVTRNAKVSITSESIFLPIAYNNVGYK
jgi:hypothetical protein